MRVKDIGELHPNKATGYPYWLLSYQALAAALASFSARLVARSASRS